MKLLIVDDHALFRGGMALLLARDEGLHDVQVSQAGSLVQALQALAACPGMDMVLFDLALPDTRGMEGLAELRARFPAVPVVVLSADDRAETVLSALDHGAAGFIPKTSEPAVMSAALSLILAGGVYLPRCMLEKEPCAGQHDNGQMEPTSPVAAGSLGLSRRQLEVLRLLLEGKPNKLICRQLSLSEPTVKTHLAALYRKLSVNTRTQAVVRAAQLGLRFTP